MKKRKRNAGRWGIGGAVVALALLVGFVWEHLPQNTPVQGVPVEGTVQVQFLDVGQADCSLITLPNGGHMLIDAGGNATAQDVADYLKGRGITRLDYVIGTHPHEDHIGGLDVVIENFEIGELYLPRIADDQTPTTKTYEDVLDAAAEKGLRIHAGKGGETLIREEGLTVELLAPNSSRYEGLNSYSIVAKLTFGECSFLFMGDAEEDSEREILERYAVSADVLKVGHHGSSTSTCREFLSAVSPRYAVISCGRDNSYGHPHQETVEALKNRSVEVYRTDQDGTVTVDCDGKALVFSVEGDSKGTPVAD